jgi:hypothetical protein
LGCWWAHAAWVRLDVMNRLQQYHKWLADHGLQR